MATNNVKCNFCHKTRSESAKLIGIGENLICDKCISKFSELLTKATHQSDTNKPEKINNDHLNPILIREFLDKYIVGQNEAKITLSVVIANHYKRMLYDSDAKIEKSNLIITGPSGSGKSLLVGTVAKFLNVPFITVDATTLTEAGYIGENVDSIISRLVLEANGDIDAVEHGIVFLDEIDKISIGHGRVSSGENKVAGIQSALLKMVEGSKIRIPVSSESKRSLIPQTVEIDTTNILFIAGGAFSGMKDVITLKEKQKKSIGFNNQPKLKVVNEYSSDDFIEYGIIPEFIGRFPIKTHTNELTVDELIKILTTLDNSILNETKFYFKIDNIDLEFTSEFIQSVAEKSKKEKTGVRGLRTLCESVMMEHLYLLSEYKSRNISKMIFDSNTLSGEIPSIELYSAAKKS